MEDAERCPVRVLLFAASLRSGSVNARLATLVEGIVAKLGAEVVRATMADFDCPSYDGDLESAEGIPAGAQRLHDRLVECDAFMITSPEYNGSMPGILKNTIDWASRFRPQPF